MPRTTKNKLARRGRGGDSEIGHLTPGEAVVPRSVLDVPGVRKGLLRAFRQRGIDPGRYIVGGNDDSVNPTTGAREFYDASGSANPDDEAGGFAESGGFGAGDFGDSSGNYGQGPESQDNSPNRDNGGDNLSRNRGGDGGNTTIGIDPTAPLSGGLLTGIPDPALEPGAALPPAPAASPPATTPAAPFEPADASVATQLGKVLASDSPLLAQARTRAKQAANRRGLLNSSIAAQAGEAAAYDVALPIASQQAAQIHQRNLSEAGIGAQERIAASNISAFDREKATAAVAQIDNTYNAAFSTIAGNENIPAATREAYLTHIAAIRDSNFSLIQQLYNISLVWASPVG